MICFREDNMVFNLRVAGVAIEQGYVLLHRNVKDNFWALPGGRLEFMETSIETIHREMKEELGLEIDVVRQLWDVENFFEWDNIRFHEVGIYYLIEMKDDFVKNVDKEFRGIEQEVDLIFKWFKISELENIELYPKFLRKGIKNLPDGIQRMIVNE